MGINSQQTGSLVIENSLDDDGNVPPLEQLVNDHYQVVYRFSYRLSGSPSDAEDLTQQTFLTAQNKLDQLRSAESGRGWLCAIARNLYFKKSKKQNRMPSVSLDHAPEISTDIPNVEFDSEELQAALNELPEEYRAPLILFYFQDLSYKTIASHLDIPLGTVMSRLARGKQVLKQRLSAEPHS